MGHFFFDALLIIDDMTTNRQTERSYIMFGFLILCPTLNLEINQSIRHNCD